MAVDVEVRVVHRHDGLVLVFRIDHDIARAGVHLVLYAALELGLVNLGDDEVTGSDTLEADAQPGFEGRILQFWRDSGRPGEPNDIVEVIDRRVDGVHFLHGDILGK